MSIVNALLNFITVSKRRKSMLEFRCARITVHHAGKWIISADSVQVCQSCLSLGNIIDFTDQHLFIGIFTGFPSSTNCTTGTFASRTHRKRFAHIDSLFRTGSSVFIAEQPVQAALDTFTTCDRTAASTSYCTTKGTNACSNHRNGRTNSTAADAAENTTNSAANRFTDFGGDRCKIAQRRKPAFRIVKPRPAFLICENEVVVAIGFCIGICLLNRLQSVFGLIECTNLHTDIPRCIASISGNIARIRTGIFENVGAAIFLDDLALPIRNSIAITFNNFLLPIVHILKREASKPGETTPAFALFWQ
ncbi:hypothetical protein D3C80_1243940 [compost metagenome]